MAEKKVPSFEENLEKLESIVKKLETGEVPLDEAIDNFNEAMKLAKLCDDKLKNATNMVNKILSENNSLEDFEVQE